MNENLKKLIEKYFPQKESQRIIKLIENDGEMKRDSYSSEYKLTLRAINKLRTAEKLLEYPEILNIVRIKRKCEHEFKNLEGYICCIKCGKAIGKSLKE